MCLGSAAVCEINRTGSTENTAQIRRSMQIRDSLPQGDTELSTVTIIQNVLFCRQLAQPIGQNEDFVSGGFTAAANWHGRGDPRGRANERGYATAADEGLAARTKAAGRGRCSRF